MIRKEDGSDREQLGGKDSRSGKVWPAVLGVALVGGAIAAGVGAGCSHASKPTAPGCCEKSGPGWTDDAGADSAAPVASVPAKPPARFRLEEGCARDFKWSGEGARDLVEVERLCAQGLAPILAATETSRSNGAETVDVPFRVTGSTACLRAAALGVAPGQIISIENARGTVLARAAAVEALAVVPVDGTVCVREPGTYRLVVKAPSGGSEPRTLTVQVWQASRD